MGFKITIASLLLIACGVVMSFKILLAQSSDRDSRPVAARGRASRPEPSPILAAGQPPGPAEIATTPAGARARPTGAAARTAGPGAGERAAAPDHG